MYGMKEHANPRFMFTGRIISCCSCFGKTFSKDSRFKIQDFINKAQAQCAT
jgi:hypothetical protein